MRHALIVFVGCNDDDADVPSAVETKYAIDAIHAVDEKDFRSEDTTYTLLRIEYGEGSWYCAFVVDGEDYPLDFEFATDEDALFDEDIELTGHDLAIFDDEEFDEWLWETDSDDEILVTCFD